MSLIAVLGPTASGKSSLGMLLAEKLDGEIVSCDSMQVYKGMDIGTAKPSEEEQQRIPHHIKTNEHTFRFHQQELALCLWLEFQVLSH